MKKALISIVTGLKAMVADYEITEQNALNAISQINPELNFATVNEVYGNILGYDNSQCTHYLLANDMEMLSSCPINSKGLNLGLTTSLEAIKYACFYKVEGGDIALRALYIRDLVIDDYKGFKLHDDEEYRKESHYCEKLHISTPFGSAIISGDGLEILEATLQLNGKELEIESPLVLELSKEAQRKIETYTDKVFRNEINENKRELVHYDEIANSSI